MIDGTGVDRPGDARLSVARRSHADHRQGPSRSGAQYAQRAARACSAAPATTARSSCKFVPLNADFENGDQLVTSGIDGVYPPGLPVAQIANVERNAAFTFRAHHLQAARGRHEPHAGAGRARRAARLPERPAEEPKRRAEAAQERRRGSADAWTSSPATRSCCRSSRRSSSSTLRRGGAAQHAAVDRARRCGCRPDFVALVVLYWCIEQPRRVGFTAAFAARAPDGRRRRRAVRPARARLHDPRLRRHRAAPPRAHVQPSPRRSCTSLPLLLVNDLIVLGVRAARRRRFPGLPLLPRQLRRAARCGRWSRCC